MVFIGVHMVSIWVRDRSLFIPIPKFVRLSQMQGFQLFSSLENPLTRWCNTVNYSGPMATWAFRAISSGVRPLRHGFCKHWKHAMPRSAIDPDHDLILETFVCWDMNGTVFSSRSKQCSSCVSIKLWSSCSTSFCLHVLLNVLSGDWTDGKHGTKRCRSGESASKFRSSFQVVSFTWEETWKIRERYVKRCVFDFAARHSKSSGRHVPAQRVTRQGRAAASFAKHFVCQRHLREAKKANAEYNVLFGSRRKSSLELLKRNLPGFNFFLSVRSRQRMGHHRRGKPGHTWYWWNCWYYYSTTHLTLKHWNLLASHQEPASDDSGTSLTVTAISDRLHDGAGLGNSASFDFSSQKNTVSIVFFSEKLELFEKKQVLALAALVLGVTWMKMGRGLFDFSMPLSFLR